MTITSTTVNSVTSLLAIQPANPASLDRVVTFSRCTEASEIVRSSFTKGQFTRIPLNEAAR